ncbi:hypothetical protein WKG83_23700, partial [Pantoea agglomerans]
PLSTTATQARSSSRVMFTRVTVSALNLPGSLGMCWLKDKENRTLSRPVFLHFDIGLVAFFLQPVTPVFGTLLRQQHIHHA